MSDPRSIDDYIDRAKLLRELPSYSALARHLGVTEPTVNAWRSKRQWPSDDAMTRLADAAGIDRHYALLHLNSWRASSLNLQNEYLSILSLLKSCKAVIIALLMALGLLSGAGEQQGNTLPSGVPDLYIMR